MYKKLNFLVLLSAVSLIQACDKGPLEVPTRQGCEEIARMSAVNAKLELTFNALEKDGAHNQLKQFRTKALKNSLQPAIVECEAFVRHFRSILADNAFDFDKSSVSRILVFTEQNCTTLKAELETKK